MEGRKELKIDGTSCKQMSNNCGVLLGGDGGAKMRVVKGALKGTGGHWIRDWE